MTSLHVALSIAEQIRQAEQLWLTEELSGQISLWYGSRDECRCSTTPRCN